LDVPHIQEKQMKMNMPLLLPGLALVVALAGAPLAIAKDSKTSQPASEAGAPVSFQVFAVQLDTPNGAAAGPLDITIDRWTTEAERAALRSALIDKGSDALLSALQDAKKAGFIRATGGGLGWDIRYARREPLPGGGYRVVFATDRPMSFYERTSQPRSADYEFLVAELRIGADGQGEGKLFPAAKVTFDKGENTIEIENYQTQPVQLTKVKELKSKPKASSDEGDKDPEKDKAAKRDKD
jgi:hypothetical protein